VDTKFYSPNGLLEDIKELNYRKIQNGKAGDCLLKTDNCFNSFFMIHPYILPKSLSYLLLLLNSKVYFREMNDNL
jgi:hypothetical protein